MPYYLNWIRREREAGRSFDDFSRGNEEISKLLLQGLNDSQKQIVQLAACCREFDRATIRHLLTSQNLDFTTAADPNLDCFEWLRQRDFVEYQRGCYRLDDVARDVFRLSLWYEDRGKTFRQVCETLATYFAAQADAEVTPDSPPPARYGNAEWRRCKSEFLYYIAFAGRSTVQTQWLTHLLEARYFRQDEMIKALLLATLVDAIVDFKIDLLNPNTDDFLIAIAPAALYGWAVLEETPIDYEWNQIHYELSKADTDRAWQTCLNSTQIEALDGLAKFTALFCKSRRCPDNQQFAWISKAKIQAEQIATTADVKFSSGLFVSLGIALHELERYGEAINSYDQALEYKPDLPEIWHNTGNALSLLSRYNEAIDCYNQAIHYNPEDYEAWRNRGVALHQLERYEEAINSYDKSLSYFLDAGVFFNKACCYALQSNVEEAIENLQRAIELVPEAREMAKTNSDFDAIRGDDRF